MNKVVEYHEKGRSFEHSWSRYEYPINTRENHITKKITGILQKRVRERAFGIATLLARQ